MIVPVFCLWVFWAALSFIRNEGDVWKMYKGLLSLTAVIMIIIITFRAPETPDFDIYKEGFRFGFNKQVEPGYLFIQDLVKDNIGELRVLFFIIGTISVILNLSAINKMANIIPLAMIFYISNNYILHDMIQIRCAVAAGISLFAVREIYFRNFKRFFLMIIVACLFHYSAAAIIPFYWIGTKSIKKWFYIVLIPISYLLAWNEVTISNLIDFIPIDIVQNYNQAYRQIMDAKIGTLEVNIFNGLQLLRVAVVLVLLYYSEQLSRHNLLFIIWLKLYSISLLIFILFWDYPVVSIRISEFYQIIEFLLFPMLAYTPAIKDFYFRRILVVGVALVFLLINTFYSELLL